MNPALWPSKQRIRDRTLLNAVLFLGQGVAETTR
jgi:hypothetical protein